MMGGDDKSNLLTYVMLKYACSPPLLLMETRGEK